MMWVLILQLVVLAPQTGGIHTSIEKIAMPSEEKCEEMKPQLMKSLTWVQQKNGKTGEVSHTLLYSIARGHCVGRDNEKN